MICSGEHITGYNQIYRGGAIREAPCLAHLRRKIFDDHDSQPTELSTTAMAGIQAIYRIEEEIRGLPPAERLAARRTRTRPLVRALRRQLMRQAKGLSRHADIAKAFAYGTKRWRAFNRFLYDGQLKRAIRGFTVGRRNWLFSGSFAAASGQRSCSASSRPASSAASMPKPTWPMSLSASRTTGQPRAGMS
ncbi:MAG: hypothetical protein E5V92_01600 [Mesorhizobium sp.]|nr:MAG: hypothetical protein E5V92_01600 [Mesorhizobium sp.]